MSLDKEQNYKPLGLESVALLYEAIGPAGYDLMPFPTVEDGLPDSRLSELEQLADVIFYGSTGQTGPQHFLFALLLGRALGNIEKSEEVGR